MSFGVEWVGKLEADIKGCWDFYVLSIPVYHEPLDHFLAEKIFFVCLMGHLFSLTWDVVAIRTVARIPVFRRGACLWKNIKMISHWKWKSCARWKEWLFFWRNTILFVQDKGVLLCLPSKASFQYFATFVISQLLFFCSFCCLANVVIWHLLLFCSFCYLTALAIWQLLLFGSFCYLTAFVIWFSFLLFGSFCYLAAFVIWQLLLFGSFCYLATFVIWQFLLFGSFCSFAASVKLRYPQVP